MIKLTTRNEIVKLKKIIGSELFKMQKAFYDDETLQFYKNDNEEHLYIGQFDCLNIREIHYKTIHKIIALKHSDIKTFTAKMAEKLTELFRAVNASDFIIISHLKLDFFGNRNNRFKPLKMAYEKLEKIVGAKTYNEAFYTDIDNIPVFTEILFWITRCNPGAVEYIFIFDKDEQLQVYLCKFGNIHLTEYNKERLTEKKLAELGWIVIKGQETDNFSNNGKISGRGLKI